MIVPGVNAKDPVINVHHLQYMLLACETSELTELTSSYKDVRKLAAMLRHRQKSEVPVLVWNRHEMVLLDGFATAPIRSRLARFHWHDTTAQSDDVLPLSQLLSHRTER